MNQAAELYDMKNAPFEEKPVPAGTDTADAAAARKRLTGVLAQLNPAGGKTESFQEVRSERKGGKKKRKNKGN